MVSQPYLMAFLTKKWSRNKNLYLIDQNIVWSLRKVSNICSKEEHKNTKQRGFEIIIWSFPLVIWFFCLILRLVYAMEYQSFKSLLNVKICEVF